MTASARKIHTKPNGGATVEWITPPEIIDSLGNAFDLDPCAHPQQLYRTAQHMICPPADGLSVDWYGRVWLNPPYGSRVLVKWLRKLAEHGNGIALVPSRTEVEEWFWPLIWEAAHAVFFFRGRLYFRCPDGSIKGNAGHGSVLVAYGLMNVSRIRDSGLRGRLVRLV